MNFRIGLFDSGVGGFTVLKSIQDRHSDVSTLYLADTGRVPYGSKKTSDIRMIAREVIEWLTQQNIHAVVVACNTTNSLAIDIIKNFSNLPVFELIESSSEFIFESRIGVLSTPLTAASKAYTKNILSFNPNAFVIEQGCPEFVPMIEGCLSNKKSLEETVRKHLRPLLEANVQSIVLGCSHYPLLNSIFEELLPENIRLIDPSLYLSRKLDDLLRSANDPNHKHQSIASTRFYVTSDPSGFASKVKYWMGITPEIQVISLQSKSCVF
ncbi:glutamate racemase [Prochlorococcus marinus]|uniref:glutamate racemase n=1 Tax=Prochlorococcus marinus TaxID=1219 RepID=UPI0022B52CDA|nr:glutamate racemase [Prochlorococcus marinus]